MAVIPIVVAAGFTISSHLVDGVADPYRFFRGVCDLAKGPIETCPDDPRFQLRIFNTRSLCCLRSCGAGLPRRRQSTAICQLPGGAVNPREDHREPEYPPQR